MVTLTPVDINGNEIRTVQASSRLPVGATAVIATSGNVAAAVAAATIPAVAAKTNYLTGIIITSGGATAAALVDATIVGLLGGTITLTYGAVAGAALKNPDLVIAFDPPLPASAVNTAIVLSMPSLGAGNLKANATAHGYVI